MSASSLLFVVGANTVEDQRARWERKRSRTAKELLETEHKYLEQLDLVLTYFVTILKAKGTLKPAVLETIFGPLEPLYSASHVLSLHLEKGNLGPGLENFCLSLDLYGHYAENLEEANITLKKQVRKNKSFRQFKKLQETRPQFKGKELEDLLLLPLQRLHQYKHFFRDLLENTSPDTAEYQKLAKAVKSVCEVSHWVQDIFDKRENSSQLLRVQKLLKGQKTQVLTPDLTAVSVSPACSGRWYIREGWLLVVPSKGEQLKRRMFFLFSDILIAAKPCHPLHLLNSNKLSCQAVYPLHQCSVDKVFGHTWSQGGLLSLSFPHKTLLLMSNNQQEINDWYRSLTAAVRQLKA
ncbi:rho guanine nucleotide exchange factor 39 isoform X1 [Hirundo rustica]|uniref:rho guanine nucleotide exchange factor 39 isoform X1 n=1 Tax=Hirundo rustica TaxID=43150 RepID=UPI001A93D9E7|nr:rho guanine nucleotide exchange factor 39 isoform X1 [Hirundo rustica]XP_039947167.1 rho guanine nucleotide exchange factor 39 isoform X1 [Hirundo rustica]XP_039947168.1 rho guanine nucleotide exchange factor 39 isoform X1 [Hirundo rustica]XP_039947169.1 rho guanine nucleotide exchange factor 39 isoform X1 [Hirundo rustica]